MVGLKDYEQIGMRVDLYGGWLLKDDEAVI